MSTNSKELLENNLVWSAHRVRLLGQCERRYYHQYIGSWGGWESTASPEAQAAYHCKYLTAPAIEIGQIVHACIRVILEMAMAGYPIDPEVQAEIARSQFESFVDHSRCRPIEKVSQKRRKFLLHELGGEISPQEKATYLDQITLLLRGFFAFAEVQSILADPTRRLISEFLDPVGFSVGHELGVPSRPRTDAAFLTPDGQEIVVADWKGGAAHDEEHRQQALTYDIYVRRRLNLVPAEATRVSMFYLASGEVCSYHFSEDERQERLWQIGEEFESLRQRSDDPMINIGPESRFRPQVTLSDPVVAKTFKKQGYALLSRMEAGGKVLLSLATANEHCELPVNDLTAVGEVVMFVANFRADFQKPVSTLPEVVLLLSRVTPCFLPYLPLISADEVFDPAHVGSSAWNSYERVRQMRRSEPQSLTMMEMYELLLVLRQHHQNNVQLYALEKCLDQFTSLYRGCLQSLAAADLLNAKVRKERKRRQA